MKVEIFKSSQGYYNLRTNNGKPTEQMINYLKENGYRWSRKNSCWYPATNEAKTKNLREDFVQDFQKNFSNTEAEEQQSDEKTVQLERLVAELRAQLQQDKEKIAELEAKLKSIDKKQDNPSILMTANEKTDVPNDIRSSQEYIMNTLDKMIETAATKEQTQAEKIVLKENQNDEDLTVTPQELSLVKSVLPLIQYVSTLRYAQNEERDFFIGKIKEIAESVKNAPEIGTTDGMKEHRIILRYSQSSGTETLVTEIGKDGEAFGFQCLNGDLQNAEWGYINLNEVKNIRGMEVDYHLPYGMSVERWLYKRAPELFPEYAAFAASRVQISDNEAKKQFSPQPVTLEEILSVMEFNPEMTSEGKIRVFDIQRGEYIDNFGDEEFTNAEEIFERLDTYIYDYFIHDMEEQLEAVGVDIDKANTLSDLCSLYQKEIEKGNSRLSEDELNLAFGIVHPDTVIFPEPDRQMSVENNVESPVTESPLVSQKDMKKIRAQCREILKKSDSEITKADMAILSQYEGGGGLSEENRTSSEVLNAFYTPNNLIEKVWDIVDSYAPNAKTVLEPSAGTGRFAENRPNNEFTMHEVDETSARINKILHPESHVIQGAFQKQFFDEGERFKKTDFNLPKYDVVIGNPPYGKYNDKYKGLGEGKEFDRYEEYFIAKGLDSLKNENSVMAFVVPSGFLNSASDRAKELIAAKGRLLDAYRLPVGTFPTTKVGTDIIVMQTWEKESKKITERYKGDKNTDVEKLIEDVKRTEAGRLSNNYHFKVHPEKILGEVKSRTNRFGKSEEYTAVHEGFTISDELDKINTMLPVTKLYLKDTDAIEKAIPDDYNIPFKLHDKPMTKRQFATALWYIKDATEENKSIKFYGQIWKENIAELASQAGISEQKVVDMFYDAYQKFNKTAYLESLADRQKNLDKIEKSNNEQELKKAKNISSETKKTVVSENQDLSETGISSEALVAKSIHKTPDKEKWNITKSKGDVMTAQEFSRLYGKDFDKREFPIWRATDWQGNIDLSKLSAQDMKYLSESEKFVEKNIGEWTHKELFTSGDIYAKLDEQKTLYEESGNRLYADNISLLESAKKELLDMEHIHFGVRASLAENFKTSHIDADGNYVDLNLQESFILWAGNETLANQKWRGSIDFATANISREELGEVSFLDVVNYIDGKPVKADAVKGYGTWNMSEEEKAQEKAERKKEADFKRQIRRDTANRLFDRYIHEGLDDNTKTRLCAEYNRHFNSYVAPDYSKLPLFVDGMSAYKGDSKFKLYEQQIKGISFLCNKGNGLLAYDVGVGKTAAGIVATVNQIQTGRCKRPLIVVPNQVYSKWYTDMKQLFPNIKVNDLYNFNEDSVSQFIDKENPHKLNIEENSISLCTYEALRNITFTDESCRNELYQDFANLLSADMDGSDKENAESSDKIKGIIGSASHVEDENYFFFEECGFDNLTVDEAHNFKNLWVVPRPKKKGESNEYSGIPSGKPSARALKMYGMTQLTQRNNDNRNVFMLTATPFTNSPTEVYSMLSYVGRERLKEAGIDSLRSFFDQFAQTKQELGVNSKGEIDTKQVMKSWKELPALQAILTEFIDKVDGEEAGIIRPNKFTHVKPLDMSEVQMQMRQMDENRMAGIIEGVEAKTSDTIVSMNNMRISCVAPALANPLMYPGIEIPPLSELVETSPKLKFVCDAIVDMYKNNPEKGQFMYVPLGKESHGIIKEYLVSHGIPKEAVGIINGDINNTPEKKEKITSKFNDEKDALKIIIGGRNTAEGIDLNGNSFVMYNCSLGWNPSETIQAEGRIWRQGNLQGNVHIVYPVMNDSIDSVLYQKHDEKRSRINELWNYKGDSLNVEDINPEDLKLDLIKDPKKKAKLILQEKTKEFRAELSKINLKIKDFDDIIEKRRQLTLNFDNTKLMVEHYENMIKDYKERSLGVPEWVKLSLKKEKAEIAKSETCKTSIADKLSKLGIATDKDVEDYIRSLNTQKHICEEKIKNVERELPEIMEKLKLEQAEQKLMEYPAEKQREILEADILNNLRPMKEVEYEIKTMRYETMLAEKLKSGSITLEEYDSYKRAGYEMYEKWQSGEVGSLGDGIKPSTETRSESDRQLSVESDNSDSNAGTEDVSKESVQQSLFAEGELFFGLNEDTLTIKSPENRYGVSDRHIFNAGNDDIYLTPEQLTKAEQKRDDIVLPILNGKESGMYKAFKTFAEHGIFDVIGTKIDLEDEGKISNTGWFQLRAAMNIYRSKEFETFRYVLVDKKTGKINEQLAITSHMPNSCSASLSDSTPLRQVIARAEETDSLVVAVHNHPSGNIQASIDDMMTTDILVKSMTNETGECRFAGHIILDHDTFNLYTPKTGWSEEIDSENYGRTDELLDKNFAFSGNKATTSKELADIASKINDTNNWNDDFIPVVFTNSNGDITGLKLYDKDFFDNDAMKIRNIMQFNGLEAGAVMAFPILTKDLWDKLNDKDKYNLEEKMKDLISKDAFTDVAIVDTLSQATTLAEKYGITPGLSFFTNSSYRHSERKVEISSTWETRINPSLFAERLEIKQERQPFLPQNNRLNFHTEKKASGMEY